MNCTMGGLERRSDLCALPLTPSQDPRFLRKTLGTKTMINMIQQCTYETLVGARGRNTDGFRASERRRSNLNSRVYRTQRFLELFPRHGYSLLLSLDVFIRYRYSLKLKKMVLISDTLCKHRCRLFFYMKLLYYILSFISVKSLGHYKLNSISFLQLNKD